MKRFGLSIALLAFLLTGCDSTEVKARKKEEHLASFTCGSSKEGRTTEELQAIADACFKGGSYSKSSGIKW
ncbi:hypothetical protein LEAN103870_17965 [Legionella anisa]|uniref:Entry exclusion lipoprotein TrbK n=1 Tax=Legionella anisa TaxID=28082 RepID=A0AAX0WPY6_9GAMM|nr:hypothetical protein [Legionella anisa]AWN73036.1 hypothetical protein DLD14_03830 [Legionella anisa]KTC75647.1 hypothetical protein Lani_0648 [Legionella anisa]MBN5936247.1 hypothetical protein [Legionella anisa]MCW8423858.1 hypothetical protein [Legionella anisa]MCW8447380.1 hypothetical protein [Legionella anisa]